MLSPFRNCPNAFLMFYFVLWWAEWWFKNKGLQKIILMFDIVLWLFKWWFKKKKKKKLESVPFPRARVKLGGRVSSYQVTQPLTYIFEPLTVAEIQGLLQTLFMYAQCQHPQPLVTWRGHHVHFLMFGKDKIHWQCYSCRMKLFEVWPFWPLTSFP